MVGRTLSHNILSDISRGGMGIVYRALDLKLDREVALKVTAKAIQEISEAESTLLPRWHDATGQRVPIRYSLAQANLESVDEEEAAEWSKRIVESDIEHVWWPIEYVRSFYEYWKDGDLDRERVEEAESKLGMT